MQSKGRIVRAALAGIVAVGIGITGLGTTHATAQEPAPAKELARNPGPPDMQEDRIERVTGELSASIGEWKGVRSCGRADRATDARQAAYERWIGQQTLARPRKVLLVAGVGPARWRSENRRVDGRRSCKGWYESAPAYAHFY